MRGEVSRALEAARQQGKIGKGIDAVLYVPSVPEEQWLPLLEAKGEALLTTLFNVSGTRLKQRAPGEAVRYESQDIPGLVLEVVPAQTSAGRSASAAGPGARAWARMPRTRPSASAAPRS